MQIELPEQAGGDRAPRPPILGAGDQLACARAFRALVETLDRKLQAEIVGGPDIGPAEREEQIDLRRPSPDALELDELGQDRLIRQLLKGREVAAHAAPTRRGAVAPARISEGERRHA